MAPLSFYFNTGIGVVLVLVSMACFVFTIKSDTDFQPGRSLFLAGQRVANRNSAREVTVEVAAKISNVSMLAPNYFTQYQMEVQAAIEGAYLSDHGNLSNMKSTVRHFTEIVLNHDNSRQFLNGLVFIDDTVQSTTHLLRRNNVTLDPHLMTYDHSTYDTEFRPLSNLSMSDLPEGLPTFSVSDLKISAEDIGRSKIYNKGETF